MPTLKRADQLLWGDLEYIESPDMALRTIKSIHGAAFTTDVLHNASYFDLPVQRDTRFDAYGPIERQLNHGEAYLIHHNTISPLLQTLSINEQQQAQWTFRGYVGDMFRNAFMMAMHGVRLPTPMGVLRQEPSAEKTEQERVKQEREKHVILLNLEGQNDRPLPLKHNITLYVENITQGSTAVRQLNDVIYNPFSRVFSTEKGDKLKVYAIPDSLLEARKDLNDNKSLALSESKGLINALEETGQETRQDGAILHHMKYVVPTTHIESDFAKNQLEMFSKRLSYPAFLAFMQPTFGSDIPDKNYRTLYKKLKNGEIESPKIQVQASLIEGHEAAFDKTNKTIIVHEKLVLDAIESRKGKVEKLLTILVEEFGHYIDHVLRNDLDSVIGGDAEHDEGAIFAYRLGFQSFLSSDSILIAVIESEKFEGELKIDLSDVRSKYLEYSSEYEQMDDGKTNQYEFFGAGYGNKEDKRSHGHRSIELILATAGFDKKNDLPVIYFGNWLRDFSQVVDPTMVRPSQQAYKKLKEEHPDNHYLADIEEENGFKLSREALTKLVGLLAVQEFKKDGAKFSLRLKGMLWAETGQELLGCYRPEEHIDNPVPGPLEDHEEWVDYSQLDDCFAKPPTLKQLEINPNTLLKNYIATDLGAEQNFKPATAYLEKKLKESIDLGKTEMGLIALGEALHVLEDYFSHSNFIELALLELGYESVYPWVSADSAINGKFPLVTGGFGSTDMAHSLAPKFHAMIPHEIKPYNSPDLKNIAPEGEEPKWRSADDELILLILADIDQAEINSTYEDLPEVKSGYLGVYQEYLTYRDMVRNGKANPWIKWVFEGTHYTLEFIRVAVTKVLHYLLEPLAHAIDDAQTIHQDLTGQEVGTNPTHSQLAKDHDDHPLHDIAAKLAQLAVKEVGTNIMLAFEGSISGQKVISSALSFIVHPKDTDWYKEPLSEWAKRNKKSIERTHSRHELEHLRETVWEDAKEAVNGFIEKAKRWPVWNYHKKLMEVLDDN